jgi:hypothetical protein
MGRVIQLFSSARENFCPLHNTEKRDASLLRDRRCTSFLRSRFGEFLFELVDPVLQRG